MTITTFLALMPMLIGLAAELQRDEPKVRSLVVQDELIIRVPVRPLLPPIEWIEMDGPTCIYSQAIRGAVLSGESQVDFLLIRGRRLRAKLAEDCHGLDYYSGFYLVPEDERICAGRDMIRLRMGGSCRIEQFRRLAPRRAQSP